MTEQECEYFSMSSPDVKFKVLLRLFEQLFEKVEKVNKRLDSLEKATELKADA